MSAHKDRVPVRQPFSHGRWRAEESFIWWVVPDGDDIRIGKFATPDLAAEAVADHNRRVARLGPLELR